MSLEAFRGSKSAKIREIQVAAENYSKPYCCQNDCRCRQEYFETLHVGNYWGYAAEISVETGLNLDRDLYRFLSSFLCE